ncbi:DUF885 domain-containing protein [Nevskia soli]|uniref:DUF885 domain-containing protein n=1 Tax=Nevskia soli TaxID=418856 RepID=UPI0015D90498|nr:DUF885 domain-containing protein [Nevskia soli]
MRFRLLIPVLMSAVLPAQAPPSEPAWVTASNRNAQIVLQVLARYAPENAASLGIRGLDDKISIPSVDRPVLFRRDLGAALKTLQAKAATEQDPLVKQDLEIMIEDTDRNIRASAANQKLLLSYANVGRIVFGGIHGLLDDQIDESRRPAALVRLKRYAGIEPGYTPTTVLAETVWRESAKDPAKLGPPKSEVEQDLAQIDQYTTGIGLLLEKYKMKDYQSAYAKLRDQLTEYEGFVRKEVLPKAREDFRLPPELYQIRLENAGVDFTAAELVQLAHSGFNEIQAEMQPLAVKVAKEHNFPSSDYRDVVRALKKDQLTADSTMPVYHKTLSDIEAIIKREHLVTLPDRPAIVRIASAAETAEQPAPHMRPPPLLNNHGERGQFVLPGGTTGANGKQLKYDDFTFAAAAWTLTAHEARPGHELQFDTMVERGVSEARAIFAFNSTNAEGWGLYSEWMMYPYMPDDAKLISLQLRLLRAARAFLDPELQMGKVTPAQAMQILQNDVVLSEAFATEEVDRFTFRSPGQAVSYYDGYLRMRQLRADTEKAMGSKFNVQRFHDFILDQGLLPPALLRKAVTEAFVPRG